MEESECIFCKIIRGEIPSTTVYESDTFVAFLDISPVSKGHTLIVPRRHMETLFEVAPELGDDLLATMQRVGKAVMSATGAQGMNVIQNNYPVAGQEVAHVHWHLIPRFPEDGLKGWPQRAFADMKEAAALAEKIRASLSER